MIETLQTIFLIIALIIVGGALTAYANRRGEKMNGEITELKTKVKFRTGHIKVRVVSADNRSALARLTALLNLLAQFVRTEEQQEGK